MRFCFMELMRNDLREVVHEWNTHRIRPSRGSRCPAGVPDELYFMPSAPAAECLISNVPPLCPEVRAQLKEPTVCSDPVLCEYLVYLCTHHGWQPASTVQDAAMLYRRLQTLL